MFVFAYHERYSCCIKAPPSLFAYRRLFIVIVVIVIEINFSISTTINVITLCVADAKPAICTRYLTTSSRKDLFRTTD